MTIITISRGSYSRGKEVAEKAAKMLGYECISRDVLLDASEHFHIPEIKLARAIHDAPTLLSRFTINRRSYIAYIRSALTERVKRGNVVYHGLAGHVLLTGIDHVLKVRIIADINDRVRQEMTRENCSREEALYRLRGDDEERRRWTQSLYGVDPWEPSLYDVVIHVHRFTVEDAVEMICGAVEKGRFNTSPASEQKMSDLALACAVEASIVDQYPECSVTCEYGNVVIHTKRDDRQTRKLEKRVKSLTTEFEGINSAEVHTGVAQRKSVV